MDLFNEIAGMNSKPAISVKKKKILHQGYLPVNILELSELVQKGFAWAFLIEFRVVYYKAAALLRHWLITDFVFSFFFGSLCIFFKHLVFGIFPEKNLLWILFIAKLRYENCRLIALLKETPQHKFPWEFSKLLQWIIFLNISVCGEEVN